jgi:hypothetical protein
MEQDDIFRVVGGSAVLYDVFQTRVVLPQHAVERSFKKFPLIVRRRNDRDGWTVSFRRPGPLIVLIGKTERPRRILGKVQAHGRGRSTSVKDRMGL